jgi:hypothetical protein
VKPEPLPPVDPILLRLEAIERKLDAVLSELHPELDAEPLLRAIFDADPGAFFTVGELIEHARLATAEALREELVRRCGALNPKKIGQLLRALEGVQLGRFELERGGKKLDNRALWRVGVLVEG